MNMITNVRSNSESDGTVAGRVTKLSRGQKISLTALPLAIIAAAILFETRGAPVTASPPAPALGAVDTTKVYPLPEFQRLVGFSRWAVNAAERRGLRTVKVGRRKYVRGADWDAFLAQAQSTDAGQVAIA